MSIQKITLLLIIICYHSWTMAQEFEWAKTMGGTLNSDAAKAADIKVDASGSIYLTGTFTGTVDFDPGPGVQNLTSIGYIDAFVQKLDSNGNFLWCKNMGGGHTVDGLSITVNDIGEVYSIGEFRTTSDFDPSAGVHNLVPAGEYDMYIQKLDANGNFLWVKQMGNGGTFHHVYAEEIIAGKNNTFYVIGGAPIGLDLDPDPGTVLASTSWSFIQKFDGNGNLIWAKCIDGPILSIAEDELGYLLCVGTFVGTVDFDPSPSVANLTNPTTRSNGYLVKLDANGNFIWARANLGSHYCINEDVITDRDHNVYVGGYFRGTADFDPSVGVFNLTSTGNYDSFIQKLDASGNLLWAKQIRGTIEDRIYSLGVDSLNNLYFGGDFKDIIDADPGVGTFNLTSTGNYDVFVGKLNPMGDFLWTKRTGNTSSAYYGEYGEFVVDASSNVYMTNSFRNTMDLDPNIGVRNFTASGGVDFFVQKLNACTPNIDVVAACSFYTWIDGNTYTTSNNTATHTLVNSMGCDSVITLNLTITTVDPSITIDTVGGGPIIRANSLTASNYFWMKCKSGFKYSLVAAWGSTYEPITSGSYALRVVENGCVDTSDCIPVQGVMTIANQLIDINNPASLFKDVKVFPNPNQGLLNVDLGGLEDVSIEIFSASGQSVYQENNINETIYHLNFSQPEGVYVIGIETKGQKEYFKLIKIN